jgi:hypothetical protein
MAAGFIKTRWVKFPFPRIGITALSRETRAKRDGLQVADGAAAGVLSGPVSQPLPADLAAEGLRRLDAWLGLSRTARREWGERLPAVIAASLALTGYAWSAGLKPIDLRAVLFLALLTAVVGYYSE